MREIAPPEWEDSDNCSRKNRDDTEKDPEERSVRQDCQRLEAPCFSRVLGIQVCPPL